MVSSGALKDKDFQADKDSAALPAVFGTTMAALLPRDPDWMFLYWEITEESKRDLLRRHGEDLFSGGREVIRVHDLTGGEDGAGSGRLDIPVMFEAGSWYVQAQGGGRSYCCELGLVRPNGEFVGIVKTNPVALPPGRVSEVNDERWLSVSGDFDKLLQLSGVENIGRGSGEVARSLAQRWEMLRAVFSRSASWGMGELAAQAPGPGQKTFRLAADCELILYGATEPDAFVTVAGRRVKLNPDGTFSMRFALPEGNTDLPVRAVSKDESETRQVRISVDRATGGPAKI